MQTLKEAQVQVFGSDSKTTVRYEVSFELRDRMIWPHQHLDVVLVELSVIVCEASEVGDLVTAFWGHFENLFCPRECKQVEDIKFVADAVQSQFFHKTQQTAIAVVCGILLICTLKSPSALNAANLHLCPLVDCFEGTSESLVWRGRLCVCWCPSTLLTRSIRFPLALSSSYNEFLLNLNSRSLLETHNHSWKMDRTSRPVWTRASKVPVKWANESEIWHNNDGIFVWFCMRLWPYLMDERVFRWQMAKICCCTISLI